MAETEFTHDRANLVRLTGVYLNKAYELSKQGLVKGPPDAAAIMVNVGKAKEIFDQLDLQLAAELMDISNPVEGAA